MLDESAKMDIIKNALAQGYEGDFTDLFIQQEQAMQQQQQGQPQQQNQEQQPQQPSQPMPAAMEEPQYEGTGDLVQSYQDSPPGMANNPMGENVSGVVSDASSYQTGGMYRVSDMIEYERGGEHKSAEVDDYVNKLRKNVKNMGWKQTGGPRTYISKYTDGGKKTEGQRRRELSSAISNVSTNSKEKKLLEVTNYMENSMGYNPEAYGRNYTNSQASIDPIMLNDLFDERVDEDGKKQGYSSTQKKYFERFKKLGLPTTKKEFKKELNSDNAEAAVEAMRMVYGRSPEVIPEITDTAGMFKYYNDNYRKNNEIKDLTKSRERFYEGYKKKFKSL